MVMFPDPFVVDSRQTADPRKGALNIATALIDAAALSPGIEEWISRQLAAGQRPSAILAELEQGGHVVDRACTAIADGVGRESKDGGSRTTITES